MTCEYKECVFREAIVNGWVRQPDLYLPASRVCKGNFGSDEVFRCCNDTAFAVIPEKRLQTVTEIGNSLETNGADPTKNTAIREALELIT